MGVFGKFQPDLSSLSAGDISWQSAHNDSPTGNTSRKQMADKNLTE